MENKNIISAFVIVLLLIGGIVFYLNKTPMENDSAVNTDIKGLVAGPVVGSIKSETLGEYLTDTQGMTLYVFADDKKLKSSCVEGCLAEWPPFMYDNKDLASFTDILSKRMNVMTQSDRWDTYAYGEKPVYYYRGDKNPGDANGNGLGDGKWSVVPITQ